MTHLADYLRTLPSKSAVLPSPAGVSKVPRVLVESYECLDLHLHKAAERMIELAAGAVDELSGKLNQAA